MAALPTLSPLQTRCAKPYLPLLFSPNPNSSCCLRFPLLLRSKLPASLSLVHRRPVPAPAPFAARCSSDRSEYEYEERTMHPRPKEIPWSKDLANSVHLIGIVGAPVQIKHLSSGKVLAWTRLGVKKSATETTWINLTLWDDLANAAFQHVEKGQQVYVSGRLVSDVTEGADEKRQTFYKIVVQQLNFVERSIPAVSLYEPERTSSTSDKHGSYENNTSGSTEELWQAFFANPVDWWDNRNKKRTPRHPDFKHKHTGEALWIDAKNNPQWVKSQLAILDSRMGSLQDNGAGASASFMYRDDFTPF